MTSEAVVSQSLSQRLEKPRRIYPYAVAFGEAGDRMLDDLAEKGAMIELLRLSGLPAEEANFRLMPDDAFEHQYGVEPHYRLKNAPGTSAP